MYILFFELLLRSAIFIHDMYIHIYVYIYIYIYTYIVSDFFSGQNNVTNDVAEIEKDIMLEGNINIFFCVCMFLSNIIMKSDIFIESKPFPAYDF